VVKTIYTFASHMGRDATVFVELRDPNRGDFFQMSEPDFVAAGHTRWQVPVPSNEETSFIVQIREVRDVWQDVTKWDRNYVEELVGSALLNDEEYGRLTRFIDEKEAETDTATVIVARQNDYNKVVSRQDQLRQNLSILGNSAREEVIRNRILDDLESSEDRRRQLEAEIAALEEKMREHQATIEAALDEIFSDNHASKNEE
jgi:hypothetical protein